MEPRAEIRGNLHNGKASDESGMIPRTVDLIFKDSVPVEHGRKLTAACTSVCGGSGAAQEAWVGASWTSI